MKAHCLMNIGFEGPGYIADWMDLRGHFMQVWKLFEDLSFPDIEDVDMLVIMGGPMNIYEEDRYPFLVAEKELIRACIREQKPVLGICLGAQLIADALGEKVFKNREKEIGWFPVHRDGELEDNDIQQVFPGVFFPLHWHGETFDLPEGANLLGSSAACHIQGFIYRDFVIALQFHLEVTSQVVDGLLQHAADDLTEGAFVQSVAEIKEGLKFCPENKLILFQLLDRFLDPDQKNNCT